MRYKLKKSNAAFLGLLFLVEGCKRNESQNESSTQTKPRNHSNKKSDVVVKLKPGAKILSGTFSSKLTPSGDASEVEPTGNLAILNEEHLVGVKRPKGINKEDGFYYYVKASDVIPTSELLVFLNLDEDLSGFRESNNSLALTESPKNQGAARQKQKTYPTDQVNLVWNWLWKKLRENSKPIQPKEEKIETQNLPNWQNGFSNWYWANSDQN
jgi:hypothetical protein